jgi:hypothetical protein
MGQIKIHPIYTSHSQLFHCISAILLLRYPIITANIFMCLEASELT